MKNKWQCDNLEETAESAGQLLTEIKEQAGSLDKASVLALSGNLGAGKTTWVQKLAAHLGVVDQVNSPTFVLRKRYPLTDEVFKDLVHFDAYRLHSAQELADLGWREDTARADRLICVEWPERVREILPKEVWWLRFEVSDQNSRLIRVSKGRKDR